MKWLGITWWIPFNFSLVFLGYKKSLTEHDLWSPNPRDITSTTFPPFEKAWKKALRKCHWWALYWYPSYLVINLWWTPLTSFIIISGMMHRETKELPWRQTLDLPSLMPSDSSMDMHLMNIPLCLMGAPLPQPRSLPQKTLKNLHPFSRHLLRLTAQHYLLLICVNLCVISSPSLVLCSKGVWLWSPAYLKICISNSENNFIFCFPTHSLLIEYTENPETPEWKGYLYAALFFVTTVMTSVFFHQLFHIGMTLGMRIKAALIAAIYKKVNTIYNNFTLKTLFSATWIHLSHNDWGFSMESSVWLH